MKLPYDMGNAGDLLKHGVLAEFVRWQCEVERSFRFIDLFGGEPEGPAVAEVARRVGALQGGALRAAQTGVEEGRYLGSGLLARRVAANVGRARVRVLTGDREPGRQARLRAAGLSMVCDEFPGYCDGADQYDAYEAFEHIARVLNDGDLVMLDPFGEFVPCKATEVVPQVAEAARRAAVLLFALNRDPHDEDGRRFDVLLEQHLPGASRMTCPPMPTGTGVKGESRYYADVVLAARPLLEHRSSPQARVLHARLAEFAMDLARVLDLPAPRPEFRVVGG